MLKVVSLFALLLTCPALAADDVALPRERPASAEAASPAASAAPADSSSEIPLPRQRPEATTASSSSSEEPPPDTSSSEEPPPAPPPQVERNSTCPALVDGEVTATVLPPIRDGLCGMRSPLSVTAITVNGRSVPLASPATIDCGMAVTLPAWVSEVDSYALAHEKTRIDKIYTGPGYSCRNVDHAATGSLSFHSYGDALDIIGFSLSDGRRISIQPGYNGTPAEGRDILHFARDAACTHFMTVLGPEADAYHQDNMHLDLACHGKACTARLCE